MFNHSFAHTILNWAIILNVLFYCFFEVFFVLIIVVCTSQNKMTPKSQFIIKSQYQFLPTIFKSQNIKQLLLEVLEYKAPDMIKIYKPQKIYQSTMNLSLTSNMYVILTLRWNSLSSIQYLATDVLYNLIILLGKYYKTKKLFLQNLETIQKGTKREQKLLLKQKIISTKNIFLQKS